MVTRDDGRIDVKTLITIAAFLIQISVLVWGAAKLSATVESLSHQVVKVTDTQERLSNAVNRIQQFNAVCELRLNTLEKANVK